MYCNGFFLQFNLILKTPKSSSLHLVKITVYQLTFSKLPSSPALPSPGPEWYLVRVELTVTDVNDNVPEWSMVPAPYLAVVSPDAPAGSLVYKLQAQDGDEGNNGEVEYFLSDGRVFLFNSFLLHVL